LKLLNISKRKAEADISSLSPCFCNLACKKQEGARGSGSSCSDVRIWPFKYSLKYNFPVSSSIYPASFPPLMTLVPFDVKSRAEGRQFKYSIALTTGINLQTFRGKKNASTALCAFYPKISYNWEAIGYIAFPFFFLI
jgi:hypothetical protein